MHRLVMPDLHTQQCTNAATDDCEYQQGCFGYAPAALFCFDLINAIDQKGHDVDNHQII
jgi:hypothetical protein